MKSHVWLSVPDSMLGPRREEVRPSLHKPWESYHYRCFINEETEQAQRGELLAQDPSLNGGLSVCLQSREPSQCPTLLPRQRERIHGE